MSFGKRIDEPGGSRRAVREPALTWAVMMTTTESFTVDLLDLSKTGARLRGRLFPGVGHEVLVLLGRLEAFGTIVWQDGELCGLQFDVPLGEDAVATIRRECVPPSLKGAAAEAALSAQLLQNGFAR